MRDIYLILENGLVFKGKSFGAYKEVIGEVVFTTGMVGYTETLTDPSYKGQIVVQTFPLIGNYGVMKEDMESDKIYASAYVVREKCDNPSNFRCETTLEEFLKSEEIPAIYGIDTRKLTRVLRDEGVMNGKISFTPDFDNNIKDYKIIDSVFAVTSSTEKQYKAENPKRDVVVIDYGAKKNITKELSKRNCNVTVVSANVKADRIKELNPQGIFLSNGPGNPNDYKELTENLKEIIKLNIPIFASGLGHQLLALANGGTVKKLKYGHRGANQPVLNLRAGKVYASGQNHGYYVDIENLPENCEITFKNANDGTIEGLSYNSFPAYSVQFNPEACGGSEEQSFIFDEFINLMEVQK